MSSQSKQHAQVKFAVADSAELLEIGGGIWDYSNRLGILGQMLEDRQDAKYGVSFQPKTIDAAAKMALQGWVSVP